MAEWTGIGGKRVLMTGATNGIGLAAAEALAGLGAELAIVARSESRATTAVARIEAAGGSGTTVDTLFCDLSSQASIRLLAAQVLERYPRIDALVNNAGAVNGTRRLTEDSIELTWAVNHLATFLLTTALLGRLNESAPARIVTTSSDAHIGARIPFEDPRGEHGYGRGFRRYGETKLANILFTTELARRLMGTGVTANCFHPGLVATGFNRNNGVLMSVGMAFVKPFSRTPRKGAETLVWLLDSPEVSEESGAYFVDMRRKAPSAAGQDLDTARRLWDTSEEQIRGGPAADH